MCHTSYIVYTVHSLMCRGSYILVPDTENLVIANPMPFILARVWFVPEKKIVHTTSKSRTVSECPPIAKNPRLVCYLFRSRFLNFFLPWQKHSNFKYLLYYDHCNIRKKIRIYLHCNVVQNKVKCRKLLKILQVW